MLFLFNTNITPSEAVVRVSKCSVAQAAEFIAAQGGEFVSAIGHEATAKAMSQLLGVDVPVNRINADPKSGDWAISLKLNGRLPEGQVLGLDELNEIGFTFYSIEFCSPDCTIVQPVSPTIVVENGKTPEEAFQKAFAKMPNYTHINFIERGENGIGEWYQCILTKRTP